MLGYEWGNPSSIMLSGGDDDPVQDDSDLSRNVLDHYTRTFNEALLINPHGFNNTSDHQHHHHFRQLNSTQTQTQFHSVYEQRSFGLSYPPPPPAEPVHSLEPVGCSTGSVQNGFMVVPKSEPVGLDFSTTIGLNLGRRTYFSSSGDDYFVNHLYNPRSRMAEPGSLIYRRCQAEGCNADLTHAKHYHRRHKVCEFHSKAATVIAGGLTQRFCQQCSRFHLLLEFDNGKRSCRKRLADHNRRRRKSHQQSQEQHNKKSKFENAYNSSSENIPRSPQDSGVQSTSSVTVANSSPRMSLEYCFQQRSQQASTSSSSASTNCPLFFSNV